MLKLYVVENGKKIELTNDMYWFEENMVGDINDSRYVFQIYVDDVLIWTNKEEK